MSLVGVWYLMVVTPLEAAGRQVGPFINEADCVAAAKALYDYWRRTPAPILCFKSPK